MESDTEDDLKDFKRINRTRTKCLRPRLRGNVPLVNTTLLPECEGRPASLPGGRRQRPCGDCTDSCVFSAIEMCLVIGIIANIIVIFRVVKDRKLRSNTFVGIACLALADAAFLVLNLASTYEYVIRRVTCTFPMQSRGPTFAYFKGVVWFSANGHVALMAVIRYIIIVYPIKSQAYLTFKKVILMSVGVWILAFIVRGIFTLIIKLTGERPRRSVIIYLSLWIIIYLLPLLVTVTLHILKIRKVKKASYHSETAIMRKSIARMSKIIIVVIICATVLPLPKMIFGVVNVIEDLHYPTRNFKSHFRSISNLLFLLNNCINPCIYAFMSKPFRYSVLRMFGKEDLEGGDSSSGTVPTPVIKRRETQESVLQDVNVSQDSLASTEHVTMATLTQNGNGHQTEGSQCSD